MSRPSRRHALLTIAGATASLGLPLRAALSGAPQVPLHRWRGIALGATAEIVLAHPDRAAAVRLIEASIAEIDRLESVFSLFRPASELVRLNAAGRLAAPSHDLLLVLSQAQRIGVLTRGAFDPTVQPLWRLFAQHYSASPTPRDAPARHNVDAALALVDYRRIDLSARGVRCAVDGMAVTLNGIAQGYITDRVADLLRNEGLGSVLVEVGEVRAIGAHPAGRPWRIGLEHPRAPGAPRRAMEIAGAAIATSAPSGFRFDPDGRHHHIFDPKTGTSPRTIAAVTVEAQRAATADALSTALCVLPWEHAPAVLAAAGAQRAIATLAGGRVATWTAGA